VAQLRDDIATAHNEQNELEQRVQRLKRNRDTLETTIRNLRDDTTHLTADNRQADARLVTLQSEIIELESSATTLQTQLRELRRRGYTDAIVSQIISGDAVNAGELLRRISTLGEYEAQIQDAQNTLQALNRDCTTRQEELNLITTNLEDIEKKRLAAERQLRRLRDERRHLRGAIKVVDVAMHRYRFTDRDFERLWRLLGEFGVEERPGQTLAAISRVLETHRTLTELEAAVDGRHQALAAVNTQLRTQEQRLEVSRLAFTRLRRRYDEVGRRLRRAVGEIGDEFDQTLTQLRDVASQTLTQFAEDGRTTIDDAKNVTVHSLQEIRRISEATIEQLVEQYRGIHQTIQTSMELERAEQERRRVEFGQLQAEAGQFSTEIQKANVLLGLKLDPEALRLVSKNEVQLLLSRIIEWRDLQTWDLDQKPEMHLQVIPEYQRPSVPRLNFMDTLQECLTALQRSRVL
jgi:chromosome segregation ATPase